MLVARQKVVEKRKRKKNQKSKQQAIKSQYQVVEKSCLAPSLFVEGASVLKYARASLIKSWRGISRSLILWRGDQ